MNPEYVIVNAGRHSGEVHRVVKRIGHFVQCAHEWSGNLSLAHQYDTKATTAADFARGGAESAEKTNSPAKTA